LLLLPAPDVDQFLRQAGGFASGQVPLGLGGGEIACAAVMLDGGFQIADDDVLEEPLPAEQGGGRAAQIDLLLQAFEQSQGHAVIVIGQDAAVGDERFFVEVEGATTSAGTPGLGRFLEEAAAPGGIETFADDQAFLGNEGGRRRGAARGRRRRSGRDGHGGGRGREAETG
jgi:hypothetical protein